MSPGVAGRLSALALGLLVAAGAPSLAAAQGEKDPGRIVRAVIDDAWITAKTKIALFADPRVKVRQVSVDTLHGIVALRGKVDSPAARAAAVAVAGEVDGVRRVRSELQIVPAPDRDRIDALDRDLTKQVRARLISVPDFDRIDVRTDRGVVTLRGNVPELAHSARASETAAGVRGVKAVRNELAYGPEVEARQRTLIGALLLFAAARQKSTGPTLRPSEPEAGQVLEGDGPGASPKTSRPAGPKTEAKRPPQVTSAPPPSLR